MSAKYTRKANAQPIILALDCEMVEVKGLVGTRRQSALAEVVLVNTSGTIVYHSHVSPPRNTIVTDYRTHISGITKEILAEKGRSFLKVQQEVARRINGAILVGHALENDLKALGLQYPRAMIRNTAHLPQFQTLDKRGHLNPQKLKNLAARYLDVTIQEGEHDPAEDARAAMALYTKYGDLWEENSRPIGPTVIGKNKTRRRVRSRKE